MQRVPRHYEYRGDCNFGSHHLVALLSKAYYLTYLHFTWRRSCSISRNNNITSLYIKGTSWLSGPWPMAHGPWLGNQRLWYVQPCVCVRLGIENIPCHLSSKSRALCPGDGFRSDLIVTIIAITALG